MPTMRLNISSVSKITKTDHKSALPGYLEAPPGFKAGPMAFPIPAVWTNGGIHSPV